MSRDDSPPTDDAYESEYDERTAHEDAYHDESGSFLPYVGSSFGWPPGVLGGDVEEREETREADDPYEEARVEDEYGEHEGWFDEGVIALTLVVGLALFLFPEPATSAVGIVLLLVGSIAWLADAMT